jgi:predicted GNAT family acetyltransferase
MARIRRRGETPFLHVRSANARAIQLYERLGFKLRREFELCVVAKIA